MFVGLAVAAVVALFVLTSGSKYRRIYNEAHFRELLSQLESLKPRLVAGSAEGGDPPSFLTSAGVVVCYTVSEVDEDGHHEHHISLSYQGGYLARGAGLTLIAFLTSLIGVDLARVRPFDTQTGVLHAVFHYTADEQRAFEAGGLELPQEKGFDVRVSKAMNARSELEGRLEHVQLPPRTV